MKKEKRDVPLRTAYSQAGRLWQPKPSSLRAQAQLMRTETVETFELVKVEPKLLREEKGETQSSIAWYLVFSFYLLHVIFIYSRQSTSSPSGILPTIQSESLLQIPIPTTATTTSPGNNLNTLVSPLETETRSRTAPDKLNSVSTENLPESVPNESNSEHSTAAEAQQIVKRKSREIEESAQKYRNQISK
ncbi:hypothetical protein TNCV_4206671 [Trichonephila clavipes]|nr:hypothetical protein TNCV_4206671 [Trichonephila clavipes]